MIVPMKKVSLVVLEKERREALRKLRKMGVLHVEEVQGASDELSACKEHDSKINKALGILSEIKLGKRETQSQSLIGKDASYQVAEKVLALSDEKKSCLDRITNNSVELERLSKWGSVDPKDFADLAEKGIYLTMYEIPFDKYALIGEKAETVLVANSSPDKAHKRFLLVSKTPLAANERPEDIPPEAYQVVLPRVSTSALEKEIEDSKIRIDEIGSELKSLLQYKDSMKSSISEIAKDIEFENLYSGMGTEEKLSWITGYVPVDSMKAFEAGAKEQKWAYAAADPSEDDNVPTKLKNNRFVSLIYPLTDFLGTVPGYHEYDISGWFLFFFTIFFGMIFGDGGYGALVTLVSLIFIGKSLSKKQKVPPMMKLVLLLGLATMIWGAVTCTWFGLGMESLPSWLKAISVPPLSNAYSDVQWIPFWMSDGDVSKGTLSSANNLQIFCFTLALIQLCVAHLKGIARYAKEKSLKCIAEFGSFIELIGMYWVVLSMVVNSTLFPMIGGDVYGLPWGTISIALVGIGFALSFVFANYEGSIGKSILESVKNIISVLLGVVNVFSDIVSYIRLWAVGLAGAAISGTVNTMAGPMVGHAVMFFVLVILLVFGHGLNMILNLLSVIVHGVRLNTLEFSNHLGMSWSGFKYKPFSEK